MDTRMIAYCQIPSVSQEFPQDHMLTVGLSIALPSFVMV